MKKFLSLLTALALIFTLITPTTVIADDYTITNLSYNSLGGVCMFSWNNIGYSDGYVVNVYNSSDGSFVNRWTILTNAIPVRDFELTAGSYYFTVCVASSDSKIINSYTATSGVFTYGPDQDTQEYIVYNATYDSSTDYLTCFYWGDFYGFRIEVYSSSGELVNTVYKTSTFSSFTVDLNVSGYEIVPFSSGEFYCKIYAVDKNGDNISSSLYWTYCLSDTYTYSGPTAVVFDANGGYLNGDSKVTTLVTRVDDDGKVAFPTKQFKMSNMLEGWYTAAEGGTQVDEDTVFTSDTTVYAHWVTCDHAGGGGSSCWIYARCSICGDYIPLADHNLVYYEAKDATCTEDGNYEYWKCSGCGAYYSDSNGDNSTTAEAVTITAVGSHSYDNGVVTTEATCTEDGEITYTCSVCHDTYTEAIAATGHSYDDGVVTTEATCTENGAMTYTCSVCNDTYTEAIPATGHTEGEVVVENEVAATCTEDGSYDSVIYCTVCEAEVSRVTVTTSAAGHSYVDGVCENCGELGASEGTTTDTSSGTETSTVVVSDTVNSVLKPSTLDGATVNQATISITSTETGTLTVTEIKDTVTSAGTLTFSDSSSSYTFATSEGEITGGTVLSGVETNSSGTVIENTGTVLFYGDIDFATSSNNATASTLTITLDVSGTLSSNGNITADNIKLLHYENGGWVTVDGNIEIGSNGTITISAETDSYSPFAVILVSEVKKTSSNSQAEALALLMRIQALAANTNTSSGTTKETEETTVDLTEEIVEIEEPVEAGKTDLE